MTLQKTAYTIKGAGRSQKRRRTKKRRKKGRRTKRRHRRKRRRHTRRRGGVNGKTGQKSSPSKPTTVSKKKNYGPSQKTREHASAQANLRAAVAAALKAAPPNYPGGDMSALYTNPYGDLLCRLVRVRPVVRPLHWADDNFT